MRILQKSIRTVSDVIDNPKTVMKNALDKQKWLSVGVKD